MSGKLIFGLMASVIMTGAWGASSTVTSRDYVDNALATKQVKILSAGTAGTPAGETVITYTASNGQIGERALFTGGTYDSSTDADKLITAAALNGAVSNIPTTETSKLTCMDSSCLLYNIITQTAYGNAGGASPDLNALIGNVGGLGYGYISNDGSSKDNDSTYGLTQNGTFVVDYGDGKKISGKAQCSSQSGTNNDWTWTNPTISSTLPDSSGQYCYCQLDGYTTNGDNWGNMTALSAPWVFFGRENGVASVCANKCVYRCEYNLLYDDSKCLAFRAAVFNSVQ